MGMPLIPIYLLSQLLQILLYIMMRHTVQTITVISNVRTLFLRSKASYMPINLARHFTLLYSRHSFAWEELLAKFPSLPSHDSVVFADLRMSADYTANHPKCPVLLSSSTIIRKIVAGISALTPTERMCSTCREA